MKLNDKMPIEMYTRICMLPFIQYYKQDIMDTYYRNNKCGHLNTEFVWINRHDINKIVDKQPDYEHIKSWIPSLGNDTMVTASVSNNIEATFTSNSVKAWLITNYNNMYDSKSYKTFDYNDLNHDHHDVFQKVKNLMEANDMLHSQNVIHNDTMINIQNQDYIPKDLSVKRKHFRQLLERIGEMVDSACEGPSSSIKLSENKVLSILDCKIIKMLALTDKFFLVFSNSKDKNIEIMNQVVGKTSEEAMKVYRNIFMPEDSVLQVVNDVSTLFLLLYYKSNEVNKEGEYLFLPIGCVAFSCVNHDTEPLKESIPSEDFTTKTLVYISEHNTLFSSFTKEETTTCPWCQQLETLSCKEDVLRHCIEDKTRMWQHKVCENLITKDYPFVKRRSRNNHRADPLCLTKKEQNTTLIEYLAVIDINNYSLCEILNNKTFPRKISFRGNGLGTLLLYFAQLVGKHIVRSENIVLVCNTTMRLYYENLGYKKDFVHNHLKKTPCYV